jgi:hypothetical protein
MTGLGSRACGHGGRTVRIRRPPWTGIEWRNGKLRSDGQDGDAGGFGAVVVAGQAEITEKVGSEGTAQLKALLGQVTHAVQEI